jgi:hypothetical protein
MPVTIQSATHPARALTRYHSKVRSAKQLLEVACHDEWRRCSEVIQSSFDEMPDGTTYAKPNGFVHAAIVAYSDHHHLQIRPEDIWLAILNQLSFYINGHAEELRQFFVSHEGQMELKVIEMGTLRTLDYGPLAIQMTQEIEKNVNDPELRTWVMPDFSTTTYTDHVTAAVLFMGAMQGYFSYAFETMCGIPSVTLLGERADWENIRSRLDKLERLGEEPAKFGELLKIVLEFFVKSFDDPKNPDVLDFWGRIAHETYGGSGPTWLSGWITAFCFWNEKGKRLHGPRSSDYFPSRPEDVATSSSRLDLDDFHSVDTEIIPMGYSSVPVTVNDNGIKYKTRMVAGSVGMRGWSSGHPIDVSTQQKSSRSFHIGKDGKRVFPTVQPSVGSQRGIDSIQPVTGWWLYILSKASEGGLKKSQDMGSGEIPVENETLVEQNKLHLNAVADQMVEMK